MGLGNSSQLSTLWPRDSENKLQSRLAVNLKARAGMYSLTSTLDQLDATERRRIPLLCEDLRTSDFPILTNIVVI